MDSIVEILCGEIGFDAGGSETEGYEISGLSRVKVVISGGITFWMLSA